MQKAFKLALYAAQKEKEVIYLFNSNRHAARLWQLSPSLSICVAIFIFRTAYPSPTTRIMRKSLIAIIRF